MLSLKIGSVYGVNTSHKKSCASPLAIQFADCVTKETMYSLAVWRLHKYSFVPRIFTQTAVAILLLALRQCTAAKRDPASSKGPFGLIQYASAN